MALCKVVMFSWWDVLCHHPENGEKKSFTFHKADSLSVRGNTPVWAKLDSSGVCLGWKLNKDETGWWGGGFWTNRNGIWAIWLVFDLGWLRWWVGWLICISISNWMEYLGSSYVGWVWIYLSKFTTLIIMYTKSWHRIVNEWIGNYKFVGRKYWGWYFNIKANCIQVKQRRWQRFGIHHFDVCMYDFQECNQKKHIIGLTISILYFVFFCESIIEANLFWKKRINIKFTWICMQCK